MTLLLASLLACSPSTPEASKPTAAPAPTAPGAPANAPEAGATAYSADPATLTTGPWTAVEPSAVVAAPSGLVTAVLKPGTGAVAEAGKTVAVHYSGWLVDGTQFDSSIPRGEPIRFPLGQGRVIRGWDDGVAGMKVGEKRQLRIPFGMAYGENGRPPVIPPRATLVFDVELMAVE
jgi:FKBP-type peptidyl-prolyl cis-trans isomerase